jgi:NAD(P)-dependent dehydrogenase (short-subunit alcohol dehydrogenase family)
MTVADERQGQAAMKLKDQVAIVTGAGRNIGEEVAKLFAAEGAKVAVVDLDKPRGQRTVDAIKAQGGDADLFVADVSKGADVTALVKAVAARFGRIDILVNNVAISDNKSLLEITEEDWDRVMTVTLKSQFLMSKHVAQQMIAQGTGAPPPTRPPRPRSQTSPAPSRCSSPRITSASTRSCRTRSALPWVATSSIRPAR